MRRVAWAMCLVVLVAVALPGCGRFRRPGFTGPKQPTGYPTPTDRPEKASLQWGPETAKVRVIGFFYISKDPKYQRLMRIFQNLAEKYPGKVYVRYWDMRTKEGVNTRGKVVGAEAGVGLLVNGESEIMIEGDQPHKADFNQDMGRFWTEEDLEAAVAQAVARAYPK